MSTGQRASEQIVEAVTSWPGVGGGGGGGGGGGALFPAEQAWGARAGSRSSAMSVDVIALLRLNYEQLVARGSVPVDAAA